MTGLWRYGDKAPEGKYLVLRRDGTVPEWPNFVIGAKDPAAVAALLAYAKEAEARGFDAAYVADVRRLANEFYAYRVKNGEGDPDAPPHRKDDAEVVRMMKEGRMT
jgi:hypothetical protein